MMRKHPTLRQSIFVLSAVCAFGNDRKRVPLVSSLPRKKKNLARRVRFQQRYIFCCNCDEFPSSREGGVLFHREVLPSRDDDDERREMMAPREKNESTKERSF